jgi:hypothetical protein
MAVLFVAFGLLNRRRSSLSVEHGGCGCSGAGEGCPMLTMSRDTSEALHVRR